MQSPPGFFLVTSMSCLTVQAILILNTGKWSTELNVLTVQAVLILNTGKWSTELNVLTVQAVLILNTGKWSTELNVLTVQAVLILNTGKWSTELSVFAQLRRLDSKGGVKTSHACPRQSKLSLPSRASDPNLHGRFSLHCRHAPVTRI